MFNAITLYQKMCIYMSFFILNEKDVCKHITHTKNYTTEF